MLCRKVFTSAFFTFACFASQGLFTAPAAAALEFRDFSLIARETIAAKSSDIQGPIAAGSDIALKDFALRDQKSLTSAQHRTMRTSIYSGGALQLLRAHIAEGGMAADGPVRIKNCRVDGSVQSAKSIQTSLCRTGAQKKSPPNSVTKKLQPVFAALEAFEQKIAEDYRQTRRLKGRQADRKVGDVTLLEYDQLPQVLVLDGENRPETRIVVRVNQAGTVTLQDVTVILEGGIQPQQILYWFPQASRIILTQSGSRSPQGDLGIPGTLLALNAELIAHSALLTGAAYIKRFNGVATEKPSLQVNAAVLHGFGESPAEGEAPPASQ
jgi:choice-of-anchor A domain-containing protein